MFSLPISEKTHQKLEMETAKDDTIKAMTSNLWRMAGTSQTQPLSQTIPSPSLNDHIPSGASSQGPTDHSALRLEMHKILHQGHLGIEKKKSQARQSLFWPNMNPD